MVTLHPFWSFSPSRSLSRAIAPPRRLSLSCLLVLVTLSLHSLPAQCFYTPNAYAASQQQQHYSAPEEATVATEHYKPVINVAFPAGNESQDDSIAMIEPQPTQQAEQQQQPVLSRVHRELPTASTNSWTPMPTSGRVSQLNSVYTAVNPPSMPSTPTSSGSREHPYTPVYSTLAVEEPATEAGLANLIDQRNLTYLTSESVARKSYQKPTNTYMIHPAKYQQAFASTSTSAKGKNATAAAKVASGHKKKAATTSGKLIEHELMPIPMIKSHRHGATLGFNLPEQGLTLYLDINELATKPMAQNIGLKVVSHNKNKKGELVEGEEVDQTSNKTNKANSTTTTTAAAAKILKKRVTKVVTKRARDEKKSSTSKSAAKSAAQSTASSSGTKSKTNVKSKTSNGNANSSMQSPATKAKVLQDKGTKLAEHLANNRTAAGNIPPSASRIPATYESQVRENDVPTGSVQQKKDVDANEEEGDILRNQAVTKTPPKEEAQKESSKEDIDDFDKEIVLTDNEDIETLDKSKAKANETDEEEEDEEGDDAKATTDTNAIEEDEEEEEDKSGEVTSSDAKSSTVEVPAQTSTLTPIDAENDVDDGPTLNLTGVSRKQEVIDNRMAEEMRDLIAKGKSLLEMSAKVTAAARSRRDVCEVNFEPQGTEKLTTIVEVARAVEADRVVNEAWQTSGAEQEMQDVLDFNTGGFTLILPANRAMSRLPPSLMRRWKDNEEIMPIDGYILDGKHTLEEMVGRTKLVTRNKGGIYVNRPNNETYTINGQRVVMANQPLANGGIVHVIDGLLYPPANKDIMETLKACGRLDGFVTLAEGTGFAEMLKKGRMGRICSITLTLFSAYRWTLHSVCA